MIKYETGDLIELAKQGHFDVIAHGCNCFCRMKRGIAPQMAATFHVDQYSLEKIEKRGDPDKLGRIEGNFFPLYGGLFVYNMYTQYYWASSINGSPLDYEALTLCMRKLSFKIPKIENILNRKQLRIGLPKIGAGLAGGDWSKISKIIEKELYDTTVTIIEYESTHHQVPGERGSN